MIRKSVNIIITVLGLWSYQAYSQSNCTVPLPPVLTNVSVQPETGNTDLTWTLSPSSAIAAYIIYTYKNGDGQPIDTIWDPSATRYTYASTASKYLSISYVVTAYRLSAVPGEPGCTSPLSNAISTIFCSPVLDTCNKRITVSWNKYPDIPQKVISYKILVSVNGSPLAETYTAAGTAESFSISDFTADVQYCVAVKALLVDGTSSTSNKSCLFTRMQRPPGWINADYAAVSSENKITLSFTIDPLSEIKLFALERRSGLSGVWELIDRPVSVNGTVLFTDSKADKSVVYYYRLSAVNNCNIPVTISNIASNIVLSLSVSADELKLTWNGYYKWLGTVSSYKLFMDTGRGFSEKTIIQSPDTVLTLGYKEIMYEISGAQVCFYLEATEASNPYGIAGKSVSSVACTAPAELITVPNVFTPDNDLVNDLFKPVLSFTPSGYQLIISDRKGSVLFETRDYLSEWDGTKSGEPLPQGVYLWYLRLNTPSGKTISKTGTITIVRNR